MIGIFGPSFWAAIIFFAIIGFVALLILYALKYRRTHKPPQYEDFNTMQVRNRVKQTCIAGKKNLFPTEFLVPQT